MEKKEKLIFTLIVALPIIDILTSLTEHVPLSVGALIRTGFMFFLFMYIFNYLISKKFIYTIIFLLPFLCIMLTFIINYLIKQPFLLTSEINFSIKTAYFLVIIFTVLLLLKRKKFINKDVLLRASGYASIIIGASFWIAILTNTNIKSYSYVKTGFSGWFHSANELSVIVIILLTLSIIHYHYEKSPLTILVLTALLSVLPMIGTKAAFYGGVIIITMYIISIFYTKQLKSNLPFWIVIVLWLFVLPFSPVMTNKFTYVDPPEQTEEIKQEEKITQLLSSRDVYLNETKENYLNASFIRKIFGLGYAGDYKTHPKMIEMDFYDLFFSYGVIGTILLLLPLPFLLNQILTYKRSISYILLLLTIGLCAGISFVAGHVLFAPSVMTYIGILIYIAGIEGKSRLNQNE
ncbi:O-antigen ligase family protein [Pseudogracilibacillus sp. SE30717A]|uniref:O-antigen ligase family protein n=1 Tax=Pseudogracilibacillus sp. SE30717A TaxID=3098293 RepID=UPI00300E134A